MLKNETRRGGNRTPRRCFNCRGVGHLQCDCPSLRRPQVGERRVCWTCGRPGHVAIAHSKTSEGRWHRATAAPIKAKPTHRDVVMATVKKKSASIIIGKIGEVPTEMMLDSGSARCLVSQDIVLGMKATSKAALQVCPKLVTASG